MALIRAIALKDFRSAALSTTDVSTGYNLGSSNDALKQMFAGLHLTSNLGASSTSRVLAMSIQNSSSSAFGVLTTRAQFQLSTVRGAEWAAPVAVGQLSTDKPWWRASYTLSTGASTGGQWKGLVWVGLR